MGFWYILLAILFFGILIFIHELGHFIVARLCGVKVLEFAIGMGPKLISIRSKKSGTVYSIRLFPIGGFVNMLGENGMELAQGQNGMGEKTQSENKESQSDSDKQDSFFLNHAQSSEENGTLEEPAPVDPALAKQAYCNQSVWKRILISLAGPLMNILLGFSLMIVLVVASGSASVGTTDVAAFYIEYSAEEASNGFQKYDNLSAVNGNSIRSMAQLKEVISANEGDLFSVTVERYYAELNTVDDILLENLPLTVDFIEAHFTASRSETSGLQINDTILKVNGTSVHTLDELSYEITNQGYQPLKLTVLRDGETKVLENVIVPSSVDSDTGVVFGNQDFKVYRESDFGFVTVMKHAFWRSCSTVKMVFDSLSGLFSGRYGIEAVSGPIGITTVISDAAQSSNKLVLLNLLILISINLGVMNLLPLPALDGGHILIYVIEIFRRKPLKPEVEGIINFVGLVLMLGLAILIAIKDIIAL